MKFIFTHLLTEQKDGFRCAPNRARTTQERRLPRREYVGLHLHCCERDRGAESSVYRRKRMLQTLALLFCKGKDAFFKFFFKFDFNDRLLQILYSCFGYVNTLLQWKAAN